MEEYPQILIVHTNYDKISAIADFLKNNGFLVKHIVSPLEAFKLIPTLDHVVGYLLQKESKPLSAYKMIDYIKTELRQNKIFIVISENKTDNLSNVEEELADFELPENPNKKDLDKLLLIFSGTQKIQTNKEKIYSLDYLKEVSDNNLDFIQESLELFKESLIKDLEDLEFNLKLGAYKEIRSLAHRIKPSFAMLCNQKGVKICDEITYDSEDSELPKLISELKNTYLEMINLIKSDFPNLK
ncbi:Hpt domain-containing protein [Zunongwangia sp.]|uniref:Hpt domain-containing protein n=1 Tax=Zunongwangia sp. TaxID=1965325 RepID=UPI003AA91E61